MNGQPDAFQWSSTSRHALALSCKTLSQKKNIIFQCLCMNINNNNHNNNNLIYVSMHSPEHRGLTYWGDYKSNWITTNQIKSNLTTKVKGISFYRNCGAASVGEWYTKIWFINGVDNLNWPPYRDWKADVSNVSTFLLQRGPV